MQKVYSVCVSRSSDFYELWQQHKHQKPMEINEAEPDIYEEVYIH